MANKITIAALGVVTLGLSACYYQPLPVGPPPPPAPVVYAAPGYYAEPVYPAYGYYGGPRVDLNIGGGYRGGYGGYGRGGYGGRWR